jgi:hypothetical protein
VLLRYVVGRSRSSQRHRVLSKLLSLSGEKVVFMFYANIPLGLKDAGVFPPKSYSSILELKKRACFDKCWIVENLANFDKKESPNKPYALRRYQHIQWL